MSLDALRREGIVLAHHHAGTQRAPCPRCDKSPRDRALAVTIEADGRAVWFCHRCGWTGGSRADSWANDYGVAQARYENSRFARHVATHINRTDEKLGARASREEQAGARARALWGAANAAPMSHHPYLVRKRLCDARLRFAERFQSIEHAVLVPMRDRHGVIVNLQGIDPEGNKRFLAGGKTKGAFALIDIAASRWVKGELVEQLVIGEGYATVASFVRLHPTFRGVAALSAGNLLATAEVMRDRFPSAFIVIAADADQAGARAAGAAVAAVRAELWWPGRGMNDWNDLEDHLEQVL